MAGKTHETTASLMTGRNGTSNVFYRGIETAKPVGMVGVPDNSLVIASNLAATFRSFPGSRTTCLPAFQ
jgi:hypothetical protein